MWIELAKGVFCGLAGFVVAASVCAFFARKYLHARSVGRGRTFMTRMIASSALSSKPLKKLSGTGGAITTKKTRSAANANAATHSQMRRMQLLASDLATQVKFPKAQQGRRFSSSDFYWLYTAFVTIELAPLT